MALYLADHLFSALPTLRAHPSPKRVRALVGHDTVVDTIRALVVWEPSRAVPCYAAPVADIRAPLRPVDAVRAEPTPITIAGTSALDPSSRFAAHTAEGTSFTIELADRELAAAAFTPDDPDLTGYALLDFDAFDTWLEEDDVLVGHARDPFTRIDTRHSSRHVVVERDGVVLADTHRPTLLFETHLPTRYYLRRDDVRMDLLDVGDRLTTCAYKGHATHFDAHVGDRVVRSIGWTYEEPHHDAVPVRGMIAFYDERTDVTVDGVRQERPVSPWAR